LFFDIFVLVLRFYDTAGGEKLRRLEGWGKQAEAIHGGRIRCDGAFAKHNNSKNLDNAAYGATMFNARMVNSVSKWLKLTEMSEKLPGKSVFLAFKTTVNYNRRFWINHEVAGRVWKLLR
jgi:hypothetical protein